MPCNKHAAPISLPDGTSKPGISSDYCYECFMVDTRAAMTALVADMRQLKLDAQPFTEATEKLKADAKVFAKSMEQKFEDALKDKLSKVATAINESIDGLDPAKASGVKAFFKNMFGKSETPNA